MAAMWKPGCRPFQYSLVKLHRPIIDADQMHKEGGGFTHQDSLWNSSLRNFFLLLLYALVVVDLNLNKEMTTNQRREKQ